MAPKRGRSAKADAADVGETVPGYRKPTGPASGRKSRASEAGVMAATAAAVIAASRSVAKPAGRRGPGRPRKAPPADSDAEAGSEDYSDGGSGETNDNSSLATPGTGREDSAAAASELTASRSAFMDGRRRSRKASAPRR